MTPEELKEDLAFIDDQLDYWETMYRGAFNPATTHLFNEADYIRIRNNIVTYYELKIDYIKRRLQTLIDNGKKERTAGNNTEKQDSGNDGQTEQTVR